MVVAIAAADGALAASAIAALALSRPDLRFCSALSVALARSLAKTGDADSALEQLREVSKQDQRNGDVFEQIGDVEAGRRHSAEATAAYQAALQLASDRAARKRIGNKLKGIHK